VRRPVCAVISVLGPFFLWLSIASPALGEEDKTGGALSKARETYEKAMEAVREDVLEKIERDTVRFSAFADLNGIEELKKARIAFMNSGMWPAVRNVADCRARAQKAIENLDKAYERALKDYTKSQRFDAAKSVKTEREQFLKEYDIVHWGDDLAARNSTTPRAIEATRLPIEAGAPTSKPYRLKILAQRIEGNGPLRIGIPVPENKRVEVDAQSDDRTELCVFLSVRESFVSGDLGVLRPLAERFEEDKIPGRIEFWADQGKFELKSIQLKPIHAMPVNEVANAGGPATQNDPAGLLTVNSTWHGRRWQSQNPNRLEGPRIVDAKVTRRNGNVVEIQTDTWNGWDGKMNWVLSIHGGQLRVENIYFGRQGIMEEVEGSGTINGNFLQIASKSRYTGHEIVGRYDYNKLELEWVDNADQKDKNQPCAAP
jgi:hypothetical protein